MKIIIMLSLCLLAFVSSTYSQGVCPNCCTTVLSPVVPKPTEAKVVAATCSTLLVTWQGHQQAQSYVLKGTYTDPATEEQTETAPASDVACDNSQNCTATLAVVAGTSVSWTVQAVDVIEERTFHSYPFRSAGPYIVPTCVPPTETAEDTTPPDSLATSNTGKMEVAVYPNPVESVLNINAIHNAENAPREHSISENGLIRIYDLNGRTVISKQATPQNMQLDVSNLRSGIYIIRIEDAEGKSVYSARFMKQ